MGDMYKVLYTKRAQKALRKVPKHIGLRIRERLERIAADPYSSDVNVTKLQNRPGYRLRVGGWRVIYEIENEQLVILVLRIGSRGEIYR
jgi:mRNA interferase RelE/StbE